MMVVMQVYRTRMYRSRRSAASRQIREIAKTHAATLTQIRLAWTMQRGPHVLAIPG